MQILLCRPSKNESLLTLSLGLHTVKQIIQRVYNVANINFFIEINIAALPLVGAVDCSAHCLREIVVDIEDLKPTT